MQRLASQFLDRCVRISFEVILFWAPYFSWNRHAAHLIRPFRLGGSNIPAFQFHPEAPARDVERWIIGNACEHHAAGIGLTPLRTDAARLGTNLERRASRLFRE